MTRKTILRYLCCLAMLIPALARSQSNVVWLPGSTIDNTVVARNNFFVNGTSNLGGLHDTTGSVVGLPIGAVRIRPQDSLAYVYSGKTVGRKWASISTAATAGVVSINVNGGGAQSGTIALTIPTNTNQLTNGSGFITSAGAPVQSVNGSTGIVTVDGSIVHQTGDMVNVNVTGNGTLATPFQILWIGTKTDSIWRTVGKDSLQFLINGRYHSILDSAGASGSGLVSLNGLVSSSQVFAYGTSGISFNISSSVSTHTFNTPLASAGGVTNGGISNADYTAFNGKQPQLNGTGFVKATGTSISYDPSTYLTTVTGIALGGDLTGSTLPNPTIAANIVGNTKLAQASANSILGNSTGSPANVAYLNATQVTAMLNLATLSNQGLVPAGTHNGAKLGIVGGVLTWQDTTAAGGGAVASVSNVDGTLAISPTTGAVIASLNLAHANTWSTLQTFLTFTATSTVKFTGLTSGGPADSVVTWNPATGALGVTSRSVPIFAVNGTSALGTSNDSIGLGGTLYQATTIATAGNALSITGLPNKASALGTDSLPLMDIAGKLWKFPVPAGGLLSPIADAFNLGYNNIAGGTGTPFAVHQNVYNVLDYGIKNDSSADMTALLQALINYVPKGSKIWFPAGRYRQDHCDTITKSLTLEGSQPQIVQEYSIAGNPYRSVTCGIWHGTAGDSSFYVNSTEVTIRNLAFVNSNATQGTSISRGIYYQQAANTVFENNSVYFFGRNFEIKNGGQYYIEHNEFIDATGDDDVLLQDSAQHDEGDGFFEHNYVVQFAHNITNQVEYRSGGGIHFNYNKGNALHHATAFFYAPFVGTIITECIGNGSEQCNGPEFWVKLANSGSTLNILKIQNNYMDGSGLGGHIVVDGSANGTGIQAYNISGNILSMGVADTGIVLNGVHFGGVGNNVFYGGKLKVVTLGSANQSNNMGFLALDQIQTLAETSGNINMELFSGTIGYITATANDTLVLIAPKPGGSPFEVRYAQDATGGHTLRCQGFAEVWTGAGVGGYELIGVDPRPLHVTIIKGFINANGAATITSINKVEYAGGIKYLDAGTNGESTDSTFIYLNKRFRLGFGASAIDYGTTVQYGGAVAQNKDSLALVPNTTPSLNVLAYDTITKKYERVPVPGAGTSYTFTNSLSNSGGTVTLVNDNPTPGNSKYYGTNGSGTLGYFNLGSATAVGGDQAMQYDSTGVFSGNIAFLAANYTSHQLSVLAATSNALKTVLVLGTTNAATTGVPAFSGALDFQGNDWTGAASHQIDWFVTNKTANGTDQGNLTFSYKINGGAEVQMLALTTGGFMDYNANSQTLGFVIRSSAGGNYTNIGNETISSVVQGFLDVNSTPSATAGIHFKDDGSIGLGTNNLVSRLSMYKSGSTYSLGNNGLSGVLLNGAAWTYNDNSTAPSGTVGQTAISAFGIPTITATNTGVVYTNVSNLYVAGDPILSTNVTGTNKYALNIASGHFFDNALTGIGTIPIATTNLALAASTAGVSSFNIAAGTAVASPLQGDFYATIGHLFYRDQSTTYDLLLTPTLQSILTAGSTLTTNNTIALGSNTLTFSGTGSIKISSANLGTTFTAGTDSVLVAHNVGGIETISLAPIGISPVTKAKNDQTGFTPGGGVIFDFYTPAADGTYRVGGYITVTAVSSDVIKAQISWTDETNTARTVDLIPIGAGSSSISTTGAFLLPTVDIRVKGGTTINLQTATITGTGSMTFDAGGNIQFLQ